MAITCALDNQKLSALYKVVYADLKKALNNVEEGRTLSYDLDTYMNSLFNKLIEGSNEDTVLNFMQMVPAMAGQILMTVPQFSTATADLNYIKDKSNEFRDVDNGYQAMRDFFSLDVDKETLEKIIKNNEISSGTADPVINPTILSKEADKRAKPDSALTTTLQQFVEQKPDEVKVEEPDANKNRIYNVLEKISEVAQGGVTDVEYPTKDGGTKILKLKTIVMDKIPVDQQLESTKREIARYNTIVSQGGKRNKEVPSPKERVALVIMDEGGNYVYFDEEGNITNAENGKLVYQMLRFVRKDGNKYTVKDIYNKVDLIQSPAEIVENRYKDSTVQPSPERKAKEIAEVESQQQEQFKALYDLTQSVIGPKGKSKLLSITDTSMGMLNSKVAGQGTKEGSSIKDVLAEFSDAQRRAIISSIQIYNEAYGNIQKGFSTILVGSETITLDRPTIKSREFAERLAGALTDSRLSVEDRKKLFDQFFPVKAALPNLGKTFFLGTDKEANLVLTYSADVREVAFRVQKDLKEQGKYKGDLNGLHGKKYNPEFAKVLKQENMDLKVSNKNLAMVPENKNTLVELLLRGNVVIDTKAQTMERAPLRIVVNKQNADNGIYLDYDADKGRLVEKNYTNFLLSDDISFKAYLPKSGRVDVYNRYMHFDLPSKLGDQASKAQEKQTVDKTTEVNQRIVELSGQDNSTKSQKMDQAKSNIIENTADPKVPNPSATKGISGLFNLDRSTKLPQGVTQSQLDAAKKWWDNSPLRKYIEYEHQHNIVNSDAFARFILAGRDLISEGKVGTVVLYGNGNFVDLYHESWHVFSQLFLTKQQKIDLYNEVINTIPKFKSLKGVDTIEAYEQIEEYLAEEFRKYAKNPKAKKDAPKRNSLFRRILNYLKTIFGKLFNRTDVSQDVMEIDNVKELFENLYLSSEDPSVLNKYLKNLNIDQQNGINRNALFDGYLNRGIKQASNKKEDALNRQDSNAFSNAIDSLYSEIIDEVVAERKLSTTINTKSAVLKLFNDPKNRDVAYELIKERLQDRLNQFRTQLGSISNIDFNSLKTLSDLRQNAVATIISKKGDNKYIFLRSQIENFENLNADTKEGLREKGKIYYGIRIVGDYYSHKTIKDKTKDFADIIVVDNLDQARTQFLNYQNRIGGEKNVNIDRYEVNVEAFQNANRPLTSEEEALLDNIRVLQTGLNNWQNAVKYHRENSVFDITRQAYKEISPGVEEAQDEAEAFKDQEESENEERKSEAEEAAADKIYGQPSNIKSLSELADSEVIYVLKSLFKIENGQYVKDRFGFRQLASFKHTWNTIAAILENVKTPQEMYDKLAEAALDYPEIAQLVSSKIPNPAVENSETEYDLTTSFWKTFNKHRVRYIQLYAIRAGEKFVTEVINASIDVSNVKRLFQSKFRAETDSKYTTRQKNVTRLNLNRIVSDFKPGKKFDTYNFLKAIGFYFDQSQDEKNSPIRRDLEGYANYMKYGIPYIYSIVEGAQKLANKQNLTENELEFLEKFRTEPLQTMMDGIPPKMLPGIEEGTSQKTQVERILGLEIKHGAVGSTYSVLNPEGNKVQEHTLNNGTTYLIDAINSAEKLEDLWTGYDSSQNVHDTGKDLSMASFLDPSINSWTLRSQLLRTMFNMTDEERSKRKGKELEYMMVSGTQVSGYMEHLFGESKWRPRAGQTTSNLDEYGKFLQEFHTMLKKGVQEFLRPGSKSASYGVKLNGGFVSTEKRINPNLYADIESFIPGNIGEEKTIKNIVIPYIAAEVERIRRYQETPEAKNYVGYNRPFKTAEGVVQAAGESFIYFDTSLRTSTKQAILDAIQSSDQRLEDYLLEDSELEGKIIKDIQEYFQELTDQVYDDLLSKVDYIDPTLMGLLDDVKISELDKKKTLLKAYNYNAWIHNVEMTILFNGDIAQQDHDKEGLHKRTSGLPSNGEGFRTDQAAKDFINKVWHKKNTYASSKGLADFFYDGTFKTAVMRDPVRVSKYIDEIEEGLREDYEKRYAAELKSNPKETQALIDERVEIDLEAYREMEEADGAGYITFDAYRTAKKLQGNWSQAQEDLYQEVLEAYKTGKEIDPARVVKMFPVYKVQNYGHLMGTKLPVTAMHKFALTPIIPTVWKGSELEKLHDEMVKQGIQYSVFSTGSKVGAVTSNGSYDEVLLHDKSNSFDEVILKEGVRFTPNIVHLSNLKEASQVADKFKGEVVFMTQLRKMIVDGMVDSGNWLSPRFQKYRDTYDELLESHRNIIEEEIKLEYGISKTKDGTYKIQNINKFVDLIHRELERKNVPDHLVSRINANKNGNFRVDPSIHIEAETVENLIFNISKKLIKQKMKGEALVQVPSTFSHGMMTGIPDGVSVDMPKTKAEYDALYKKYLGTNTLPFYRKGKGKNGNTASAGIAIALQGDFLKLLELKHNDGQVIGTRKRLNEMIKNDKWLDTDDNRKAVTVVGVRIPTQQKSFMESYEVYEFLPKEAGSLILMPSEAVAKSGSDYDVDKVTLFMPSLDENGNVINVPELSREQFESLTNAEKADYIRKHKASTQNKIISTISEMLLDKDFYAELVRPTNTNILRPAAMKNEDILSGVEYNRKKNFLGHDQRTHTKKKDLTVISPSVTLTPRYNVYKSIRNLVGKSVLGIAMNEIASNSLFNAADAAMPATWSKDLDAPADKADKMIVNQPVRLLLPHNKAKDGRISLSKLTTVDGKEQIAEILSNAANGLVDIETDDWISLLQFYPETANVIFYMFSAGVPVEHVRLFLMNPLVRRYGELQRIKGGIFGVLSGRFQGQRSQVASESRKEAYREATGLSRQEADDDFNNNKYLKSALTRTTPHLNPEGYFSLETLEKIVDDNNISSAETMAGFFHFLEIEAYIKDLGALKQDLKPDNNIYNSLQQVQARDARLDMLRAEGNVDPALIDAVQKDSILRTFFNNDLVSDVVQEVMSLRNTEEITDFLRKKLTTANDRFYIKTKYPGFTGEQRFVKEFKNGVLDFIYQNFLSNVFDSNGNMVNIPQSFRGKKVVKTDEVIAKGLKLENGVYYINEDIIEKDFEEKRYLASNAKLDNSYLNRGLPHFREEDPFPTKSGFYKYLFEREYLRSVYKFDDVKESLEFKNIVKEFSVASDFSSQKSYYMNRAYLELLSRHALINSFNRHALMRQGSASYTQMVLDAVELLKKVPGLRDKYPILDQIIPFTDIRGNYVITLNDQPILEGGLAEGYQQNIRELADPSIKKLGDPVENKRVTDVFRMFAKALIYQHGVGKTKYGINQALPQEEFEMIMSAAVPVFLNKHIVAGSQALDIVYKTMFDETIVIREEGKLRRTPQSGTAFKDYTVDTDVYNAKGVYIPEVPSASEQEDLAQDTYVPPVTSEPVVIPQAEIIDRSSIPENVISIEVPSPMSDFMVSFTDEAGKQQGVYVGNDAQGNPYIKLNNPPLDSKGRRPSRDTVDTLARKYLGDGLVDFMLSWKALSKEDEGIIEQYVLGVPARGTLDSKFYDPPTIEEINQQYEDKISSEIKEGVDKYLKPFAQEALEKTVQRLEEGYKELKAEKAKTKNKIVIDDYKKALSRFGTTQPQTGVETVSRYTVADLKANPNKIYIFGDNITEKGKGGQAIIRDEENAFGIPTKVSPNTTPQAYFNDNKYEANIGQIDRAIEKIKADGRTVVFPKDGLGTGLAKLKEKAPKTYAYLKQRLLEEFGFNNDTGEVTTTQPQAGVEPITPVAPTQPQTPEKKEGEYEFEFSDGFKVYTPFQLNDQQKEALFFMEDFYRNPEELNNMTVLEGYAGTGKTTIMSLFVKYLQNRGIDFMLSSPTHKANTITKKNNPDLEVQTLASALGLKPTIDFSDPRSYDANDIRFEAEMAAELSGNTIIIDEASMVNDVLFNLLKEASEKSGLKLIFMGDPKQLPPVYKDKSKSGQISPVFSEVQGVELTKVERTGDNPILALATKIRNNEKVDFKSDEKNGKGVMFIDSSETSKINEIASTKIKELMEGDNKLAFRMLAHQNLTVETLNNIARQAAFGEAAQEQYLVGELLMGYRTRQDFKTGEPIISNSVDYEVTKVEKITKPLDIMIWNEKNEFRPKSISVKLYKLELKNLILDETTTVSVIDMSQDPNIIGAVVQEIKRLGVSQKMARAQGDNRTAGDIAQKKSEIESTFMLPQNIYIDQSVPYTTEWITEREWKAKGKPTSYKVPGAKSLDYGYAHTITKSQGGTYNEVMIKNDYDWLTSTKQYLDYVAVSRASDYVYYIPKGGQIQAERTFTSPKPLPSSPKVKNTVRATKEGTMKFSFQDKQGNWLQRDDVMSDNTFDAILEGARTATTRYVEDPSYDYWLSTKKGDVIRWWSGGKTGDGEFIDVEVTKDPQPIDWSQMDDQDIMEWSLKEGWDGYKMERIKKQGTTRLKGIQIEFRKLETAEERAKRENDEANDKDNTCSSI
jgi:hypothetical protein